MTEELETYQFQLDQVNEAIEKDPDNTELQKLKDDLLQLVNLLKSSTDVSSSENSKQNSENSNSKHHSNVSSPAEVSSTKSNSSIHKKKHEKGDIVMAKWSVDKQYYEATILNVISPTSYQIVFNGYGNEEVVNDTDIKEVASKTESEVATHDTNNKKRSYSTIIAAPSTELTNPHAVVDPERKKKIKKKKEANINRKEQEQVKKTKSMEFLC